MSRKWSNMFKKLNRYFFGEQSNDQFDNKYHDSYIQNRQERPSVRRGKSSGVKVVHRYPKDGNFRFPMNVGESSQHRPSYKRRESLNTPRESDKREALQNEKKKDYFTNPHFAATHIPSPVYGFQTPPKRSGEEKRALEEQATTPLLEDHDEKISEEKEEAAVADAHEKAEHELNLRGVSDRSIQRTKRSPAPGTSTSHEVSERQGEEAHELNMSQKRRKTDSNQIDASGLSEVSERSRPQTTTRAQPAKRKTTKPSGDASNVIMTPMDRYKYEQRKKRAKENKSQSELTMTKTAYHSPPLKLLTAATQSSVADQRTLQAQRDQLEATLHQFQVKAAVTNVTEGPSIIRFEVQPAPGVKVNKVTNLSDDLKLAMAATDLRMEAPIPGKNAIGIEVPKENREPVVLRELFEKEAFQSHKSPLAVALGLDITGSPVIMDLNRMPHGLIAGATGSGKSVCINSILVSLLYKADPEEVKLLLIDPKVVELAFYKDIPHLAGPVVTDPKEATMMLKWSVAEMERRYEQFAEAGVRDIKGYNKKADEKMPYLVIIIDELADLMMVAPQDVETSISRIAQKARACGIHLLVATQRPSVDVITGLIKANIPTRIAFAVSSAVDSRTILDTGGAERLIGQGDMLLSENGASKLVRLQGTFVSDQEIDGVTNYLRHQQSPAYLFSKNDVVKQESRTDGDDLLEDVSIYVVEQGSASTSLIQRHFHIGYNRAARLMDMMENKGIVSAAAGTKPRNVLVSDEQLSDLFKP